MPTPRIFPTVDDKTMTEETKNSFEAKRKYIEILDPLFLPDDAVSHDIINYLSLLVLGMEESVRGVTRKGLERVFRRKIFSRAPTPTCVLRSCYTVTWLRWTHPTTC